MEPPRENSPSTPSRYLNSYLQQNPTELFHQNFPQRQLSNQQFYAAAAVADNLSTNNKNYLKRHHSNYDKNDNEREKKFDKKMADDQSIHQTQSYDGFSNDAYSATSISTASTGSSTATSNTSQQKSGANSNNNNTKGLSNGKKTKGRVKIKMEYIDNKLRRYTTFSKRKTGIMKKAYELSTLTGTQVMLLVASETGHVYTFATRKLQPMITSEAGKTLIQTCLNSPDIPVPPATGDQRMCATGFEETELNYSISDIGENPGDKEKDDITSTDESEIDSENDENFMMPHQNNNSHHHGSKIMQSQSPQNLTTNASAVAAAQRSLIEEEKKQLIHQQQQQQSQQRISEKIFDNQKLLLESLSSFPQNLLQSWIQSGQLKVSVDEDGMQSIAIPFAIQKENSAQEIITRKIPIKLLMSQKLKSEAE